MSVTVTRMRSKGWKRTKATRCHLLFDHIAKPDCYNREWQVGDLLIWDNCAVQHKARFDYPPELRRRISDARSKGQYQ